MNDFVQKSHDIFVRSIEDYHKTDSIDEPIRNPFPAQTIDSLLYLKNWIDTVQWHLEDIIRDPQIDPVEALALKRRIDKSNQDRTDLVERMDSFFWEQYHGVSPRPDAVINTESPAWAMDRLSILQLKIYHMRIEAERTDVSPEQHTACAKKLAVLEEQRTDLSTAIGQLLDAYADGSKIMKVYRQMKMYNDPALNPVLYTAGK